MSEPERSIEKPFPPPDPTSEMVHPFADGHVLVDAETEQVWVNGKHVLTGGPRFTVLRMLAEKPDSCVSRAEIGHALDPEGTNPARYRKVNTHVSGARRALGDLGPAILAISGRGYMVMSNSEHSGINYPQQL